MLLKEEELQVHKMFPMNNFRTRDYAEKCFASIWQLQGQDSISAERNETRAS